MTDVGGKYACKLYIILDIVSPQFKKRLYSPQRCPVSNIENNPKNITSTQSHHCLPMCKNGIKTLNDFLLKVLTSVTM